jgi:hypothetical protein
MGGFAMTIKREREREGRRIVKKGNSGVLFFYDSFSFLLSFCWKSMSLAFLGGMCSLRQERCLEWIKYTPKKEASAMLGLLSFFFFFCWFGMGLEGKTWCCIVMIQSLVSLRLTCIGPRGERKE